MRCQPSYMIRSAEPAVHFYHSENLAKPICWGCFSTAISIVDMFIACSSQKLFYSRKSDWTRSQISVTSAISVQFSTSLAFVIGLYLQLRILTLMMKYVFLQGISKIQLRDEDVMMILETLEFDGRIDRIDNEDGDSFRQAMLAIPETSAFTSIPCGVCPVSLALHLQFLAMAVALSWDCFPEDPSSLMQVFNECTPDGPISPITCIYYQQWLDF